MQQPWARTAPGIYIEHRGGRGSRRNSQAWSEQQENGTDSEIQPDQKEEWEKELMASD